MFDARIIEGACHLPPGLIPVGAVAGGQVTVPASTVIAL
jgi:hypothetical protein